MHDSDPAPVTVVIACLDAAATLQRCLDSLAEQTRPPLEIRVVDGGSTDGTVGLLERSDLTNLVWTSEPDRGIADAWNRGVETSRGAWLLFLGADDRLAHPEVLAHVAPRLETTRADVIYGQVALVDREGDDLGVVGKPWSAVSDEFFRTMAVPHQGTFHRRDLFERYGPFDTSYAIASDYELLLRALPERAPEFLENLLVSKMQLGGVSSEPGNASKLGREFLRARASHGHLGPIGHAVGRLRIGLRAFLQAVLGARGVHRLASFLRRMQGRPELPRWSE